MAIEEIHIHDLPSPIARDLVSKGAPVYVLVNPIEYHGPQLCLHNDKLISRGLCRETHEVLQREHPNWPLLWASDINAGYGPIEGPGSQRVGFGPLCHFIYKACRGLLTLGAQRVVFATFHGHPMHNLAIERGVDILRRNGVKVLAPTNEILHELIHLDPELLAGAFDTIEDKALGARMKEEAAKDIHAGFLETSLSLHYGPETVIDHEQVEDCPDFDADPQVMLLAGLAANAGRAELAAELTYMASAKSWLELRPFPAYTSKPRLANAEAGAAVARIFIERFAQRSREVLVGDARSPLPILRWWDPLGRPASAIVGAAL